MGAETKAFVPKGKFALNQEDFGGGLDDLDAEPVKKGKGGKKINAAAAAALEKKRLIDEFNAKKDEEEKKR